MIKTITPYEVRSLLAEAEEKINLILNPGNDLEPEDHDQIANWQEDIKIIFSALEDEADWVVQGKPMIEFSV